MEYILYGTEIYLIFQVFGAFLSTDMIERRKHDSEGLSYFGTGECFVFTVRHIPAFFFLNLTLIRHVQVCCKLHQVSGFCLNKFAYSFSFVPAWSATSRLWSTL